MNDETLSTASNPDPHFRALLGSLGGKILAFRALPRGGKPDDALIRLVRSAADSLVRLDSRVGELTADPNAPPLDAMTLRAKAAPEFTAAQVRVAQARAALDTAAAQLDHERRVFNSPPDLNGDVAATLRDMSDCAEVGSLDAAERAALFDKLGNGEAPELLASLARGRVGGTAARARATYAARAAAADPDRVADFEARDEVIEWSKTIVRQAMDTFDNAAPILGPAVAVAVDPTPARQTA